MIAHDVLLALAGAIGTLLRVGCNALATSLFGTSFPVGTLVVNVAGSLAFGAVVGLCRSSLVLPTGFEAIVLVGLLGGFTTFSSFAFQSLELLESGRPMAAGLAIVGTNALAIAAVWVGLRLFGTAAG